MSESSAISGVRRQVKEMADGTLRVMIDIDPQFKQEFHRLFPEIDMPVALAPLVIGGPKTERVEARDAPPSSLARDLWVGGYFYNRKLWAAVEAAGLYTQAMHLAWVRRQPCCGMKRAKHLRCSGEIVAHHADVAEEPASGRGPHPQKPADWITVPMCDGHHRGWAHGSWEGGATREDKRALHEMAVELTAKQMKEAMKRWLGIDSLSGITPEMVARFEAEFTL